MYLTKKRKAKIYKGLISLFYLSIFIIQNEVLALEISIPHTASPTSIMTLDPYLGHASAKICTVASYHTHAAGFEPTWNKDSVTKVANAVFDWQIKSYQKNERSLDQGWVSGVLYNGLFDWAESTNSKFYFDFLNKILARFYWQVGNRMYHADDLCVAQVYLDMYLKKEKKEMMTPAKARIDWIIANPPSNNIDITKGKSERWWWCDALYMGPSVFARLGKITGETKYLTFAHHEFLAAYHHLYDRDEHLFFRDGRYLRTKDADGTKVFWSRGNGWVLAGLVEMLKNLPEQDKKYRPFYEKLFLEMSAKIASLQHRDGYWRSSLLNKDIYPMPETSGTSLFTYALMYGINQGILPADTYLPVVQRGWKALVNAVDPTGRVGWTQLVAEKPGVVEKESTRGYSTGGFLMVAAELNKYLANTN
ncbi:glycoside hydrolase family 105 protein [Sphingobacterium sp. CZ-UAM]|uniref:glycoside hydrolase family 88/105 protein n=1 Tax=Sphingobacterium sp. CZ-UAM TaxID=1933868 RepID=UPI001C37A7B5|nr:glycoside hydrolase family 88 protein [Sphingobacterium sp. CZ-UAM]